MSNGQDDTRCPLCGSETGIQRGPPAALQVTLTLVEFETLVRNEWRRRLGPEGYDRSHSGEIIRDLTTHLEQTGEKISLEQIEEGIQLVMVDLRVEGKGRRALLREIAKLRHAVRAVLKKAGADFVASSDFVARARDVLDEGLDSLSSE
jgi:hypothetical protein